MGRVRIQGISINILNDAFKKLEQEIYSTSSSGGAPTNSPTFTGIPQGPTAAPGTNTTQLATTEFVLANGGSTTDASLLTSGTLADARVSSNVALKNIDNSFSADQTISKASPIFKIKGTADAQTVTIAIANPVGSIIGGITGSNASGEIRIGAFTSGGYFPTFYSENAEVARFSTAGVFKINNLANASIGYVKAATDGTISRQTGIPDADLSDNVALKNIDNSFSTAQTINGSSGPKLSITRSDVPATTLVALGESSSNGYIGVNDASGSIVVGLYGSGDSVFKNRLFIGAYANPVSTLNIRGTAEQYRQEYDASNYLSSTVSSAGVLTEVVVGTAPQFQFTRNVADAVTAVIINNVNASATGNLIDTQLAGSSKFSVSSAGAGTFATSLIFGQAGASNLYVRQAATISAATASSLLFGANSSVQYRVGLSGTTAATVPTLNDYAGTIFGSEPITEPSSGTIGLVCRVAIMPTTITNAGGTTTDAATLYIKGAMTGVTQTGFNDSFRVAAGSSRFGGGIAFFRRGVADTAATLAITDYLLVYTTLTATRAVTLPTAASASGQHFIIKDEVGNANTNNITIVGTVNGASNPTAINTAYGVYRIYSNGTSWFTV